MIALDNIQGYGGPALARGSGFVYLAPHPLLTPYIANYTVTCPAYGDMTDDYTILPTASATLVYSIGNSTVRGSLRGINTKASVVGGHASQFETLLLIEFHPAGLYPLLRIPQSELLDDSFSFEQLSAQLNKEILDAVLAADQIDALKDRLDRIFLSRLAGAVIHPQLAFAMKTISGTHGSVSLHALTRTVYLGERQLERVFLQYLGTGMKTFSRIVRINRTLRLLRTTKDSMTFVAAEAGYHDQAHFIRDFRALCGTTPQCYLNRMSDFYNDAYKM
jgi:AraC-like DNA-binding protein